MGIDAPTKGTTDVVQPSDARTGNPFQRTQRIERTERIVAEPDFRRRPSPIDQFEAYQTHKFTFVLIVLLPVLATTLYFGFWASEQYAVEVRFSVRKIDEPIIGDDVLSMLAKGLAVGTIGREPYMVANYVRSRNLVKELDQNGLLRSLYSKPGVDFFARFDPGDNDEDLWKYWQSMMSVTVDRVSGLVTVRVLAYTADDALSIVSQVRRAAERMIDQSALRARTDELRLAEDDLSRARQRYADALLRLRKVREDEQTVDPERTISATATTLLGAVREKLTLERDREVESKVLSASAPQLQVLNQRLQALNNQVAALNRMLTSKNSADRTVADAISRFEQGELERRFSEKLLEISQASYAKARLEAERQHLYLTTFVDAIKPDKAEYPKRVRTIALVSICAIIIWGVTLLLIAAVKDHELYS
jgi:capsular polysaccharide transport system permease protein